ncbi:MAG: hypothetical protein ACYC7I_13330 [Gammaproteobacteria bacterium]
MTTLQVELELPEPLAKEAGTMGLLEPQALQGLLREAVRSRRIARLTEARGRIAATGIPPLTMVEIQAEIEADRADQRAIHERIRSHYA